MRDDWYLYEISLIFHQKYVMVSFTSTAWSVDLGVLIFLVSDYFLMINVKNNITFFRFRITDYDIF